MTKTERKQTIMRAFFSFVLIAVLAVAMVIGGGFTAPTAYAATNDDLQFDETYVMDDLEGMTINGKPFDIADYSFDESRNTGVVLFTEYCYSFYSNRQGNYGLYVYVWNPKGLSFDLNSSLNMIQFSAGDTSHYKKYMLEFLSACEETNYEGLFYKFKVYMSDDERTEILNRLDSGERFYHVSGIELVQNGHTNADETAVNLEYTFSGYAEGYGPATSAGDTLVCNTEQGEVLTLEVHDTYYRPEGTSGGTNVQDTLHSVYFSVPNELIEEYGKMTAVHAVWLNALTNPIFVTGNKEVYDALFNYVGVNIGNRKDGFEYAFVSDFWTDAIIDSYSNMTSFKGKHAYNFGTWGAVQQFDERLQQLDYLFYDNTGDADNYTLSADRLKDWFVSYTAKFGGELVNGKYSKALFESVDAAFTEQNIRADKTFSLTSEKIDRSWWDKLFNNSGTVVESTTYENIEAIKEVTDGDFLGEEADICDGLYIADTDYAAFKEYYDAATAANETVYLFRYYVSEYTATECTELTVPDDTIGNSYSFAKKLDTNAYLAQMWVQLDFDIIDVTFTNGGVDTVIPVVSSPIDAVADATPPVETTSDIEWWKIILMVVALLFIIILLAPVLPYILKAVIWVVMLPFKAIAALVNAIRKAATKKPKTTASSPTKAVKAPQPKTVYVKSDKPKQGKEKQNK